LRGSLLFQAQGEKAPGKREVQSLSWDPQNQRVPSCGAALTSYMRRSKGEDPRTCFSSRVLRACCGSVDEVLLEGHEAGGLQRKKKQTLKGVDFGIQSRLEKTWECSKRKVGQVYKYERDQEGGEDPVAVLRPAIDAVRTGLLSLVITPDRESL